MRTTFTADHPNVYEEIRVALVLVVNFHRVPMSISPIAVTTRFHVVSDVIFSPLILSKSFTSPSRTVGFAVDILFPFVAKPVARSATRSELYRRSSVQFSALRHRYTTVLYLKLGCNMYRPLDM